jgi:serine/threonine protein kinase/Flp pilus assembly protein TadD
MSDAPASEDVSLESLVAEVADDFLARQRRGERPGVEEYTARHPEHATVIGEVLAALRVVGLSGAPGTPPPEMLAAGGELAVGELGDFHLVREVGRGGMGVVYEAEQLSLGRRVALKVLPFAATLDPRQFQRFRNEARAAAHLHHTNIVPVFGTGCERGVHFYAMQFIDGLTLAEVIRGLRPEPPGGGGPGVAPLPDTLAVAGLSTDRSARRPEFFRTVARLGLQAAEALEYAHQEGIVHRDVKPANLLVDAKGNLWVTDFGLARLQSDTGLTVSGDLVGTLRYMSPEQASGSPAAVDHRTDVYSLGATLYELLTLSPAFDGRDRQDLLRRITSEEPRPPRRLDPAVPAELQVIVLKALEKKADARYATAGALADDLRRFLEHKPIRARRPSRLERARKWAARHRPVVWSAAGALLVALAAVAGCVGWVVRDRAARQARTAADVAAAVQEAQRCRSDGNWPEALAAVKQAEALLKGGADEPELAGRVQALLRELTEEEADRRLVAALEEIRLRQAAVNEREGRFALEEAVPEYRRAFADYGLRSEAVAPEAAAELLRRRNPPVRDTILAALDHWLLLARYQRAPEAGWLGRVLAAADPDPWRQAVRAARDRNDRQALEKLAREVDVVSQPPQALFVLECGLRQRGATEAAMELLRRAQEAFPGDFWINHDLGVALLDCQPRSEEAVRFLMIAVALRPDSPKVRLNLGAALWRKGDLDEAIATFWKVTERNPESAEAHGKLGDALVTRGRFDEAITEFRKAIGMKPDYADAYADLGNALWRQHRGDEAVAAFRKAVELKPGWAEAHTNLGAALVAGGRLDEATAPILRAVELKPDSAEAHHALGNLFARKGRLAEAVAAYRRAIELKPDYAEAHCDLGLALRRQGEFTQALAALKRGHELGSRRPDWPYPSARWVAECQRLVGP